MAFGVMNKKQQYQIKTKQCLWLRFDNYFLKKGYCYQDKTSGKNWKNLETNGI